MSTFFKLEDFQSPPSNQLNDNTPQGGKTRALEDFLANMHGSGLQIKGSTTVLPTGSYLPRSTNLNGYNGTKLNFNNARLLVSSGDVDIVAKEIAIHLFPNGELRSYGHAFWILENGYYRIYTEAELRSKILNFVASNVVISTCMLRNGEVCKEKPINPTKFLNDPKFIEQVEDVVRISQEQVEQQWLSTDKKPVEYETIIPTPRGLYNYITNKYYPHDSRLFIHTHCPIDFDGSVTENTPCLLQDFLNQTLIEKEQQDLLFEYVGYLLTGSTRKHAMLLMCGASGAGKGVIAKLIETMIGSANCASRNSKAIFSQFGLAGLEAASVCFLPEFTVEKGNFKPFLEIIKSLTGEDRVMVDKKYKDSVSIKLPCRFVITTNEIPYLTEMSNATKRRMLGLRFYRSVTEMNKDENLIDKLRTPLNLKVFLAKCISGLRRLHYNKWFTFTTAHADLIRIIDLSMNTVKAFADEFLEETGDKRNIIPFKVIYKAYCDYCINNDLDQPKINKWVGKDLRDLYPKMSDAHNHWFQGIGTKRCYTGLTFKPQYMDYLAELLEQFLRTKGNM